MDLGKNFSEQVRRNEVCLTAKEIEVLRKNEQVTIYGDDRSNTEGHVMPMATVAQHLKRIQSEAKHLRRKNKHLSDKDVQNLLLKNSENMDFYRSHPTVFLVASSEKVEKNKSMQQHLRRLIGSRVLVEEGVYSHQTMANFMQNESVRSLNPEIAPKENAPVNQKALLIQIDADIESRIKSLGI